MSREIPWCALFITRVIMCEEIKVLNMQCIQASI